jgi:hypothetical protein
MTDIDIDLLDDDGLTGDQKLISWLGDGDAEAEAILQRVVNERREVFDQLAVDLADMQLSGAQIIAAFNACSGDLGAFINACAARDQLMVDEVNAAVPERTARRHGPETRVAAVNETVRAVLNRAMHDGTAQRADEGAEAVHQFFLKRLLDLAIKVQSGKPAEFNFHCNCSAMDLGEGKEYAVFHISFAEFLTADEHAEWIRQETQRQSQKLLTQEGP